MMGIRGRAVMLWGLAVTVLAEAVTAYLRFHNGLSAGEFNRTAPLALQIHHMFWSVPLLAVVPFVWRRVRLSGAILGISLGLILSDLLHHFVVLPLTVGNTGWHWP
ncbi:MAG: hypothetical protein ABSG86_24210 [Thermoguttaceae bacterium]|jgi:hypothetical protein